jgi:hypothetical protein
MSFASKDFRLYTAVAGASILALGLAALLARHRWSNTADTPKRFMGLDEPAESMPPRP